MCTVRPRQSSARGKCALKGTLAESSCQEKDLYSMGNALIRGAKWLETHSTIVVIGFFFFFDLKEEMFFFDQNLKGNWVPAGRHLLLIVALCV